MKCPKCFYENLESSEFCQECGFDLSKKEYKRSLRKEMEEVDDVIFKPKKNKGSFLKLVLISLSVLGAIFILLVVWYSVYPEENTSTSNTPTYEVTYNNQWKPFTSTEHGFNIRFPTDPEMERIPEETLDNGVTYGGVQYLSSVSDNEVYMVQVGEYDITPDNFDNKIGLEGAINGITGEMDASLTSSSFTKFSGYDAIDFTFSSKDYYGKGIAFIRDDLSYIKMYLLIALNDTGIFNDYNNFKSSFGLR